MNERDEIAQMILDATYQPAWGECVRAADAILAAGYRKHPELEWEYRTTVGGHDPQPHGRLNRGETTVSEVLAGFADDERPLVLERRIKAGPWEPLG